LIKNRAPGKNQILFIPGEISPGIFQAGFGKHISDNPCCGTCIHKVINNKKALAISFYVFKVSHACFILSCKKRKDAKGKYSKKSYVGLFA